MAEKPKWTSILGSIPRTGPGDNVKPMITAEALMTQISERQRRMVWLDAEQDKIDTEAAKILEELDRLQNQLNEMVKPYMMGWRFVKDDKQE